MIICLYYSVTKKIKQLYMEGDRNEITWNAPSKYSQLGSIFAVAR